MKNLWILILLFPSIVSAQCYQGDGTDDHVAFSTAPLGQISNTGAVTVEFWIKPLAAVRSGGADQTLIFLSWHGITTANPFYISDCFEYLPYGTLDHRLTVSSRWSPTGTTTGESIKSVNTNSNTNTLLPVNKWTHVAVVRGKTGKIAEMFIFINGAQVPTTIYPTTNPTDICVVNAALTGGIPMLGASNGAAMNARIDELKIWNIARSTPEIQMDMYDTTEVQPGLLVYKKCNSIGASNMADKNRQFDNIKDTYSGMVLSNDNAPVRGANDD